MVDGRFSRPGEKLATQDWNRGTKRVRVPRQRKGSVSPGPERAWERESHQYPAHALAHAHAHPLATALRELLCSSGGGECELRGRHPTRPQTLGSAALRPLPIPAVLSTNRLERGHPALSCLPDPLAVTASSPKSWSEVLKPFGLREQRVFRHASRPWVGSSASPFLVLKPCSPFTELAWLAVATHTVQKDSLW